LFESIRRFPFALKRIICSFLKVKPFDASALENADALNPPLLREFPRLWGKPHCSPIWRDIKIIPEASETNLQNFEPKSNGS